MREIKFRAWHFKLKKMFSAEEMTLDQLALLPDGHFANIHSVSTAFTRVFDYDEMCPLQFTGMLDRNGKEIYEGDIIQETKIGEKIWDDEAEVVKCPVGVVEYCAPAFNVIQKIVGEARWLYRDGGSALHLSAYDGFYEWHMVDSYAVIGNIYENPELLNATA